MTTTYPMPAINRSDIPDDAQPEQQYPSNLGGLTVQVKATMVVSGEDVDPPRRHSAARVFIEKLVEAYVERAMRHAQVRRMPDGYWMGEVVGLDGAWSDGATEEEARGALPDIIFDWAILKIADHDGDIPVLDGIDLNVL